jgi:hypothetical protein
VVRVPEVKGAHVAARRLDQVEWMARQAIRARLAADPASFDVEVVPMLAGSLQSKLNQAQVLRRRAEVLESRACDAAAELVDELLADGLTVADIGWLLGVSYRRVAQLASLGAAVTPR